MLCAISLSLHTTSPLDAVSRRSRSALTNTADVASTAPGYSLAAALGLVVAAVGLAAPAIMWLAFVPLLLVATSYYYLDRVDLLVVPSTEG